MTIYYPPEQNAIQKTLDAQLLAGITASMTLSNVTGIPNKAGVCVIDLVDANGAFTPAKREYVSYTGVSGSTLTGLTRNADGGGSDQDHAIGAIVQFPADVLQQQGFLDSYLTEHEEAGTHKAATVTTLKATGAEVNTGTEDAKIVTPKAIADSTIAKTPASAAENVTGTDNAKFLTALANVPAFNNSLARQAIINGNFDVWQRGTSVAVNESTIPFLADRWYDYTSGDGGTIPTLTRTREILTSGDIPNAFYYTRLTTNGAGTSLGVNSQHNLNYKIEHGTRYLCGDGKKVTLSFWARSSIANKRLGLYVRQAYGTGGSPSTQEDIKGGTFALTSTWTKYTKTITTNTLSGKTFGTDNNDHILFALCNVWGTTIGNSRIETSVTAETFGGSGTIDIAQVQLCAGDVALPFMPKSYEEELRACQRYYQVFGLGSAYSVYGVGAARTTTKGIVNIKLTSEMRTTPTLTTSGTAGDYRIQGVDTGTIECDAIPNISFDSVLTTKYSATLEFSVASGLTQYRPYIFLNDNSTAGYLGFSAEL